MSCIILMGIKHCGKSTQGRIIARTKQLPLFDTDDVIKEMTGKTPREIYTEGGEEAFKLAEKEACSYLVEKVKADSKDAVIATGGGICNNKEALEILHTLGTFVFLKADEEIAVNRIVREIQFTEDNKMTNLPAYIAKKNPASVKQVKKIFHEFYEERSAIYSQIADVTVLMINASKTENAERIMKTVENLD